MHQDVSGIGWGGPWGGGGVLWCAYLTEVYQVKLQFRKCRKKKTLSARDIIFFTMDNVGHRPTVLVPDYSLNVLRFPFHFEISFGLLEIS